VKRHLLSAAILLLIFCALLVWLAGCAKPYRPGHEVEAICLPPKTMEAKILCYPGALPTPEIPDDLFQVPVVQKKGEVWM